MPIERKTAANNNGYPATVYGPTTKDEGGKFGAKIGNPSLGKYTAEYVVSAGDLVSASDFDDNMNALLPAGYVATASRVYASETFDGVITVGVGPVGGGAGSVAAAIYTGTPTVGTQEAGVLLAPLDEVLTQDYFAVVNATAATAGKCKVVVDFELAIADV